MFLDISPDERAALGQPACEDGTQDVHAPYDPYDHQFEGSDLISTLLEHRLGEETTNRSLAYTGIYDGMRTAGFQEEFPVDIYHNRSGTLSLNLIMKGLIDTRMGTGLWMGTHLGFVVRSGQTGVLSCEQLAYSPHKNLLEKYLPEIYGKKEQGVEAPAHRTIILLRKARKLLHLPEYMEYIQEQRSAQS